MPERLVDALRARREELSAALDAPDASARLEPLKGEIGALFKLVDRELTDVSALKADVLRLVERWKALRPSQPVHVSGPAFLGEKPTVYADHLGASTFIEKGWNKISLGDFEGAEHTLSRALELSPNDPNAESLLGWAQMLQGKLDEALLNFQRVLVREPQNALARINVGYICLKKGIFGEAIEHLSRAIRLGKDKKATLYAHFYLGLVYLARDMFEDAQTFFQKAIALGPNLIEAYYELGRAYWFNGQREEAMRTWAAGHATNSLNPWGQRCADVLRTVEEGKEP